MSNGDAYEAVPGVPIDSHFNRQTSADLKRFRDYRAFADVMRDGGRGTWDGETCDGAAMCGHLEVLKCARANGCTWNALTCVRAAGAGHLDVLQWLLANGCPWDGKTCERGAWRAARVAAVGSRERMPVGREDVCARGEGRANRGVEVIAFERLPVGRANELVCGAR